MFYKQLNGKCQFKLLILSVLVLSYGTLQASMQKEVKFGKWFAIYDQLVSIETEVETDEGNKELSDNMIVRTYIQGSELGELTGVYTEDKEGNTLIKRSGYDGVCSVDIGTVWSHAREDKDSQKSGDRYEAKFKYRNGKVIVMDDGTKIVQLAGAIPYASSVEGTKKGDSSPTNPPLKSYPENRFILPVLALKRMATSSTIKENPSGTTENTTPYANVVLIGNSIGQGLSLEGKPIDYYFVEITEESKIAFTIDTNQPHRNGRMEPAIDNIHYTIKKGSTTKPISLGLNSNGEVESISSGGFTIRDGKAFADTGSRLITKHTDQEGVELQIRDRQLAKEEFRKGIKFACEGAFANALTQFKKAVKADEYYDPAVAALSIVRKIFKDDIDRDSAIAVFNGNRLIDEKKLSAAIIKYKNAIELTPNWSVPYTNIGNAILGLNKESEAVDWFKKALEISPSDPGAHSNMGLYWANRGQWAKAIGEFQKCIQLNPRPYVHSMALCNMGLAYEQKHMLDKAIELYKKAIKIDPTDAEGYYSLATSYYYKADYKLAVEYCEKARELGREIHPNFEKALKQYRK